MEETIFIKNVDVSKIKYSEPKTLSNGGRTVYINYGGERLLVQLPWLTLPYGITDSKELAAKMTALGKKQENQNKSQSYDLNISFKGHDSNIKIQQALEKLKEIEQTIIDAAFANREAWLRDDYDGIKNVVAKLFTPIIKYDKDKTTGKIIGKYPPTMKIKIPYSENTDTFTFDCEDKDGVDIDFKTIMNELKGGKTLPVIQLSGMWFAAGKFGCTWKLMRGRFQASIKGKVPILIDSDDENDKAVSEKPSEDDDVAADAAAAVASGSNIKPSEVSESDDDIDNNLNNVISKEEEEEEESDSEDEAPPPPPPVAKKTGKSKTVK